MLFKALSAVVVVFLSLGNTMPVAAREPDPEPEPEITVKYPGCQSRASALFGPAPLTVDFSAKSPDDGAAYNWGFGDGLGATGKDVTHTFVAEGEYNVRAFVTDAKGFYNTCPMLKIIVTAADSDTTNSPAGLNEHPSDPDPARPATNTSNASVTGDNSGSYNPVISGNGNSITFAVPPAATPAPAVAATPAPSYCGDITISGAVSGNVTINCGDNNTVTLTAPQPAPASNANITPKPTFWQWLWHFITLPLDALMSALIEAQIVVHSFFWGPLVTQ